MDFSRQCRRLLNFRVLNHENFRKKLNNISAISVLKCGQKSTTHVTTTYRLVIADNDEKSLYILNESDGHLIKEVHVKNLQSYGICCTSNSTNNHIYVSDYSNNVIRKFDENLKEIKQIKVASPCGIAINNELDQIQVIDQNNFRILSFDLKTDEFVSEFKLFQDDLKSLAKYTKPTQLDLSARLDYDQHLELVKKRVELDFKPFGLYAKNERVYVTDWNRGLLFVYKNKKLEKKIDGGGKLFKRPRDVMLDNFDNILVSDSERNSFCFMDNKGVFLFETKVPKSKNQNEKGIYGVDRIENNSVIFASNTSIYVCNLSG